MDFKICIVGCGWMSAIGHAPACKLYEQLHPGAKLVACCDIMEEKAMEYRQKFDIPTYYTDMDKMLDMEKPDAVCLIVPVHLTAELTCKILAKGYPVIAEKPPGATPEECRKMIEAAKGIPNAVSFNRRYMPLVKKAVAMIDEWGGPSYIMDIRYRMVRVRRNEPDFSSTAIHGIDLVKHIAGAPYKHIDIRYKNLPQYGETVANYHLNGEMENGIVVNLDFLPVSGIVTERLEINTHRGMIYLNLTVGEGTCDHPGTLTHFENGKQVLTIRGTEEDENAPVHVLGGFYDENADFFNDVRNGKIPVGDIASGLQSVEVAESIKNRQAAYTNNN